MFIFKKIEQFIEEFVLKKNEQNLIDLRDNIKRFNAVLMESQQPCEWRGEGKRTEEIFEELISKPFQFGEDRIIDMR